MRDEWYVARRGQDGNKRYGPVPLQQLRELVDDGKVKPEDLVWREGMANWQRADQCEALFPPAPAPSRRGSDRDPRDYPPDDRRGYGRDPRGYGPDDDGRPYRRYPPPRQSSSGWVVPLVVGGVLVGLCFLACAGFGFVSYMNARSSYSYSPPIAYPSVQPMPAPLAPPNDEVNFNPNPGGLGVNLGQSLPYGASSLYYTNTVALVDAQALGDYLTNQGFLPADHAVTVQVDNFIGTYQVRFCVRPGAAFQDDTYNIYRDLRVEIGDNVFPNSPVEVHLCDANMATLRTIRAGE